jgi:hypothetical protein
MDGDREDPVSLQMRRLLPQLHAMHCSHNHKWSLRVRLSTQRPPRTFVQRYTHVGDDDLGEACTTGHEKYFTGRIKSVGGRT